MNRQFVKKFIKKIFHFEIFVSADNHLKQYNYVLILSVVTLNYLFKKCHKRIGYALAQWRAHWTTAIWIPLSAILCLISKY